MYQAAITGLLALSLLASQTGEYPVRCYFAVKGVMLFIHLCIYTSVLTNFNFFLHVQLHNQRTSASKDRVAPRIWEQLTVSEPAALVKEEARTFWRESKFAQAAPIS